ncbi:MAG: hypothetical protein BWK79_00890 [Beggiatoa sp. IS2]|nr:MAG: hypothetical protein BWK79_00890 [Beggiatoa sp. IS2]
MRIITRGDVDGIMCATLLRAVGIAHEMVQAHPKDVQDGKISVTADDIVCNLPYLPECGMWFDHHISEESEGRAPEQFKGAYGLAPSAARLVYEYFIKEYPELKRFENFLKVVDRFDSATLTKDDVKNPSGAMLLAFIIDPRTGLGYKHDYTISNKQLTDMMPDLLLKHSPEEILQMADIKQRVDYYFESQKAAAVLYARYSQLKGTVIVTDFREVAEIPPANRFLVYILPGFETATVSVRLSIVRGGGKVSIQVGSNIFNPCKVNIGQLMAEYGGGGHKGAGTCQMLTSELDKTLIEIVKRLSI